MGKSLAQIMFSFCLLVVGIVLLLVNLGVISLEIKRLFVVLYPFLLLVYGVVLLISGIRKRATNTFLAIFILVFAGLLCLDRLHLFTFAFMDFWKLWPLIMIIAALSMMFKKSKFLVVTNVNWAKEDKVFGKPSIHIKQKPEGKKKRAFSLVGDVKINTENWPAEPMTMHNTIGNYFIDFSKAYIPDKETHIEISGWIGDVKIIIPDNLPVQIEGEVKIGDLQIFEQSKDGLGNKLVYKSPDYDEAVRKLSLHIYLNIGDVTVKKV